MGSPATEANRRDDEGPQHEVEISPFWMSKYEVTWNQYEVWSERVDSLRRAGVLESRLLRETKSPIRSLAQRRLIRT